MRAAEVPKAPKTVLMNRGNCADDCLVVHDAHRHHHERGHCKHDDAAAGEQAHQSVARNLYMPGGQIRLVLTAWIETGVSRRSILPVMSWQNECASRQIHGHPFSLGVLGDSQRCLKTSSCRTNSSQHSSKVSVYQATTTKDLQNAHLPEHREDNSQQKDRQRVVHPGSRRPSNTCRLYKYYSSQPLQNIEP